MQPQPRNCPCVIDAKALGRHGINPRDTAEYQ
jgi:hypothetical protein